jgi:cytochrome P450
VIKEREEEYKKNGLVDTKRKTFMDTLLRAKYEEKTIDDDGIAEEVDTFMFEGHDTTSSTLTFSIHMIGLRPDLQKKLHDEVDSIFGNSDRHVTMDDMKEMKYLERFLKETLRLFPIAPMISREFTEDTQIGIQNFKILNSFRILFYFLF